MRRCRLNGSDAQHWQGSLSDRMLIAENRCADLFVSTVSPETRIGTAACASVGARYRFTRPGRGRGRPVVPVTGGRTWTQVRARALVSQIADVLVAEVVLQGLRVLAVIGEFETAGSALRSLAHAHRGCCRARRGALRTIHRAARADQRD
jgi:hypothetical protein